MMETPRMMPHTMSSALAIAFLFCQQKRQTYETEPSCDAGKDQPYRRRPLPDELAQDQGAGHEIRQLSQRFAKCGALSRFQS